MASIKLESLRGSSYGTSSSCHSKPAVMVEKSRKVLPASRSSTFFTLAASKYFRSAYPGRP